MYMHSATSGAARAGRAGTRVTGADAGRAAGLSTPNLPTHFVDL